MSGAVFMAGRYPFGAHGVVGGFSGIIDRAPLGYNAGVPPLPMEGSRHGHAHPRSRLRRPRARAREVARRVAARRRYPRRSRQRRHRARARHRRRRRSPIEDPAAVAAFARDTGDRPRRDRPRGAARGRRGRRGAGSRHPGVRAGRLRGARRGQQGVLEGAHGPPRDPGGALADVHRRASARPPTPRSTSSARPSSSRPTAWRPARA